jgi:3'-phosphoadenosine 5'-phosphosulfate (PAPS) 3'-phosphatase
MNDPLLTAFVDIARAASKVILDIYERDFAVETKKDSSPVTEADQAAEEVILERLQRFDPNLVVVAEEAVAGGKTPATAARFVLVDPLDGTKEFISKNGEFTVNLGLIEDGSPVAGVVLAPRAQAHLRGPRRQRRVAGDGSWQRNARVLAHRRARAQPGGAFRRGQSLTPVRGDQALHRAVSGR